MKPQEINESDNEDMNFEDIESYDNNFKSINIVPVEEKIIFKKNLINQKHRDICPADISMTQTDIRIKALESS